MRGSLVLPGVIAACVLAGVLEGCSHEPTQACIRDTLYLDAGTIGGLTIPDDLSVPDSSESLRIPEVVIAADNNSTGGCLEHSPAFSNAE
jgi:uncharacterized lipoprotein